MNCNPDLNKLAQKWGVQHIQNPPPFFTNTYILGTRNGQSITVADMLESIEYALQFIKANFNVDQEQYSSALKALKILQSILQNKRTRRFSTKQLHSLVDTIHEIEDIRAKNGADKKENEKIALALNLLIDMYSNG